MAFVSNSTGRVQTVQNGVVRNLKAPERWLDLKAEVDTKLRKTEYELELGKGFLTADRFLNQRYLDNFSKGTVQELPQGINDKQIRIYEISKIVYDAKEQINDKLISIYSSLHSINSAVAMIIKSDGVKQKLYVATRSVENAPLAGNTLHDTLEGNFPGIAISDFFNADKKKQLIDSNFSAFENIKSLSSVSLIPSERDEDKDKFIQGIEKFISSMGDKQYTAILLAVPVGNNLLAKRKKGFEELYSHLSPHSKISLTYAHSETDSVNKSISESFTDSINRSVSNSNGTSSSTSNGDNWGDSSSSSFGGQGFSWSSGSSSGGFSSVTSGTSFTKSVTDGTSNAKTQQSGYGEALSVGTTDTMALNFENKSVEALMKKADKELERINFSEAYGMWDYCAYFYSDDVATTAQAASIYKSLVLGHESSIESAHINIWNIDNEDNDKGKINKILNNIKHLIHPVALVPAYAGYEQQYVTPTNMVNGKELPIVLGLPRKSIPGVAVVEMAEFGREVVYENLSRVDRFMDFGCIYHMGVDSRKQRVNMDIDLLASHCFITGSSGSGKSWATYQLLDKLLQHDVKMMVIEPAKGEYKQVFGGLNKIKIFTTDPNVYKMLKINPFEFPDNLHVLTHIEKLIQIFNASWALYAAMPAILKEAVVKAYVNCGWDVMNSVYIEGICDHKYPMFSDVLKILPRLIDESDYSDEAKGNYKGALVTRVRSMTTGITSLIFERSEGIKDSILFDSNVIVDLSDIGSDETIALVMGVLIMRLGEYRQSIRKKDCSRRDSKLQHVTVLEEAHNLLKRTNKDQNQEGANIVGKSVEMISNSIKEMRTYGEGFIIIDQSPMAVDTSAIENTSTKIIMNTPARDACEELSSALSLNDEQSKELSRFTTGVAAVFQKGWLTPVLMKVDVWNNKYDVEAQTANFDVIRKLRGDLLSKLYEQQKENYYSANELRKIINASSIDSDKKEDYRELITIFAKMLADNTTGLSDVQIGEVCLGIANCGGLLEVIEDKNLLSGAALEKRYGNNISDEEFNFIMNKVCDRCEAWILKFKNALHSYVTVENADIENWLLYSILAYFTYSGRNEDSKYYFLFDLVARKYY